MSAPLASQAGHGNSRNAGFFEIQDAPLRPVEINDLHGRCHKREPFRQPHLYTWSAEIRLIPRAS